MTVLVGTAVPTGTTTVTAGGFQVLSTIGRWTVTTTAGEITEITIE